MCHVSLAFIHFDQSIASKIETFLISDFKGFPVLVVNLYIKNPLLLLPLY